MCGETSEAWRAALDDIVKRGLRKPEFLIVDGGSGHDICSRTRETQDIENGGE
jgi:hypothetical protein